LGKRIVWGRGWSGKEKLRDKELLTAKGGSRRKRTTIDSGKSTYGHFKEETRYGEKKG